MRLNGLLASPGFDQWLEGEPLDPATLLYTAEGRPRVSVFSIAHLGDAERMFFVALLLNQVVAWMRGADRARRACAPSSTWTRFMGYFPPVANPPSKGPLLTLLKQGRAFGVGVLLATQNPVDLDYKGLANTGTWFLGRLQTERDKARMLDGLEGAAAGTLDRAAADRLLSALDKRVFLLHDVHASGPTVFQTRWTLSYLRGPLSRDQIRKLTAGRTPAAPVAGAGAGHPATPPMRSRTSAEGSAGQAAPASGEKPIVPPGIEQFFVPPLEGQEPEVTYAPVVLASARVSFSDAKTGVDETRDVLYAADISEGAVPVDWAGATRLDVPAASLLRLPAGPCASSRCRRPALQPRNYAAWEKAFGRWLSQTETLELFRHRELKLTSTPGESERDFRIRLQDAHRASRDAAVEAVRRKYATKQAQLADRLRRAEGAVVREQQQASQAKLQTWVSMAARPCLARCSGARRSTWAPSAGRRRRCGVSGGA